MTEQATTDRLDDALDFLLRSMQETKDFTMEQAPLVAREIVAWKFWSGVATVAMCFSIIAACVVAALVTHRYGRRETSNLYGVNTTNYKETPIIILHAVYAIVALASVGFLCSGVMVTIKSIASPRLVVVDYVKGAIR